MARQRTVSFLLLTTLVCAGLACRKTTGVCITASFAADELDVAQLEFSLVAADGRELHRSPFLPEPGSPPPISDEDDYCIYVDDALAGQEVSCRVTARSRDTVVGQGGVSRALVAESIVDCKVPLAAAVSDPGRFSSGCADGTREGFLNADQFPDHAGCADEIHAPLSFQRTTQVAEELCQAGWHWCRPDELAGLSDEPAPVSSAAANPCAWLDFTTDECRTLDFHVGSARCQGLILGTGSLETDRPCQWTNQSDAANCNSGGWRLAATLGDNWASVSAFDRPICFAHTVPVCAEHPQHKGLDLLDPGQCWVGCCRDR